MALDSFYLQSSQEQLSAIEALARKALGAWQIDEQAQLTKLADRENVVFKVENDDETYALRVHRAGYHTDQALRSQVVWMEALQADGVLQTAPVIRTIKGEVFTTVEHPEVPEARQVSLLGWVSGKQMDETADKDQFQMLGSLMAQLHNHTETWKRPADFEVTAWDIDGLLGKEPVWGRFWDLEKLDAEQTELMASFRTHAKEALKDFGQSPDRFGLIHGDFLPENLLVDGHKMTLLDFDDCGEGWHLFDISTALVSAVTNDDFEQLTEAFLSGYRQERQLPEEHIELLGFFLCLRLATFVGWMHSRAHTEFAQMAGDFVTQGALEFIGGYSRDQ